MNKSYWMDSVSKDEYSSLDQDIKVDIAIIGGGIAGIMCAYWLREEGMNIAVIEANRILQNTTAHTTAKITSQHGLIYDKIKTKLGNEIAQQYALANETAIRTIEKLVSENHIDCNFTPQAAYVYTQDDSYIDKIQAEAKTAATLGIQSSFLEHSPLPFPIKAAVKFENQAQFHPLKFLLPLTKKITASKVSIYEQTRIVDIEESRNYILTTQEGKKSRQRKLLLLPTIPSTISLVSILPESIPNAPMPLQ